MTQPTITLTVESSALRGKLAAIAALSATGFATAKENIGRYMTDRITDRFETSHLWDGSAMPQSKASKRDGHRTLVKHGHLRDSYGYKTPKEGILLYGGAGGAKDYAGAMHWGLPARKIAAKNGKALYFKGLGIYRKSANIPAIVGRSVLGINADDEKKIGRYFLDSIERAGNV